MLLCAAIASGQGKTSVVAALARKLREQGERVQVFKCGADFIDPLILQQASGTEVEVLDLWMLGLEACRSLLQQAASCHDWVLIEGVMGLYDGQPSCADLARALHLPLLIVVDAAAMAQTAGALVHGLQDYGRLQVAAVVANRVSHPAHAQMIAAGLRNCPLLGYLPPQESSLPERHLGLVLAHAAQEVAQLDLRIAAMAASLQLDLTVLRNLPPYAQQEANAAPSKPVPRLLAGRKIAVARDAAFAFLYPANLRCLRELGAELLFFSPLENHALPHGVDAVYLAGGYPELHAAQLSRARRWQASIRCAQGAGMPIWAECGGMMALAEQLIDVDGTAYPMAGLLPGTVQMQTRIAALGPQFWAHAQGQMRGHSFHFSRFSTSLPPQAHACYHPSGAKAEAIYQLGRLQASYFHPYFPSCPQVAAALFGAGAAPYSGEQEAGPCTV